MTTATRYPDGPSGDLPAWVPRCEGTEGRYLVLGEDGDHKCSIGDQPWHYEVALVRGFSERSVYGCDCTGWFIRDGEMLWAGSALTEAQAAFDRLREEMRDDG